MPRDVEKWRESSVLLYGSDDNALLLRDRSSTDRPAANIDDRKGLKKGSGSPILMNYGELLSGVPEVEFPDVLRRAETQCLQVQFSEGVHCCAPLADVEAWAE